jgi:hypothetical protein
MAMKVELWSYRDAIDDADLTDFSVVANDGEIGKVSEATHKMGDSWLVLDTGQWIVGDKVLLPAGTIERIDLDEKKIHVDRSKEEIKNAPEYDPSGYAEQEYRIRLADYYSRFYA